MVPDPKAVFSPSSFMRARRPERFSDSQIVTEPKLTRAVFEYYLETLTSRKQEVMFEHFCRRLVEKEICPNILPQTGPTGGGDSKVDAETYPVADEIALRWYVGSASASSAERWAFAFSAKKDWKSKIAADVKSIVDTGRDYSLIYFVTNQFVNDKNRAKTEDELTRTHNISVRLLDRNWITKCVLEHDRVQLAVETLNMSGYGTVSRKVAGPRDTERDAELQALEQQIADPDRYRGLDYQLAEDCLRAALLARELELPRHEVDGRFDRSERIAIRVDYAQQRLRLAYDRAWTVYWWYEDFAEFNRLYGVVESFARGSIQAPDLELLSNLWTLLNTAVRWGMLSRQDAKLQDRTLVLRSELQRLAENDKVRPNNAMMARLNLLLNNLVETATNGNSPEGVLSEIEKMLLNVQGLAEVPVEPMLQILQELGEYLPDSDKFDRLFEVTIDLLQRRQSEGTAGIALVQRGNQKLRAGKKYDAIRLFGRAQQKLALEEYRSEWAAAMAGCGLAYEMAGLLWAARANILMAANQALSEFWKHGRFVPHAHRFIQFLVRIELQLGRVFCALAWMELASLLVSKLSLSEKQKEEFANEWDFQDVTLGILLLRTDIWELKWLDFLPAVLEDMNLSNAWMALLFALGHEDYLRAEGIIPVGESAEAVDDLFQRMATQLGSDDIPPRPELMRGNSIELRSFILGCEVVVKVADVSASISFAETILGTLESLLATSLDIGLAPYRSELCLDIRPSHYVDAMPQFWSDEDSGGRVIHIRHQAGRSFGDLCKSADLDNWLKNFIIWVTFQIAIVDDEDTLGNLIRDELALDRALNFSRIAVPIENILGPTPKFGISSWRSKADTKLFPLRRDTPWKRLPAAADTVGDSGSKRESSWKAGEGEAPDHLFGVDHLRHRDRKVSSIINVPLWDSAGWRGVAYVSFPDSPPILALCFENERPAKAILEDWHNWLGSVDNLEEIRISIITQIDKTHPAHYRIVVSSNPSLSDSQTAQFVIVSRICRMDPPDLTNLSRFQEHYGRTGRYVITFARFASSTAEPEPITDLGIEKRSLRICAAWQIGINDPDVAAIQKDDDPVIPDNTPDAPVLAVLRKFRTLP